jgi:hypothetical protein
MVTLLSMFVPILLLPSPVVRVAIDRQIDIERKKRQEIDRCKGKELDAERGGILDWQQQLQQQQQQQQQQDGDESEYESEEESAEGAKPAKKAEQPPIPDHAHYYGKGWRPSKYA